MHNIWIVARREFQTRVTSRGFLFSSLALPLILVLVWFFSGAFDTGPTPAAENESSLSPTTEQNAGYVDQAGLIEHLPPEADGVLIRAFADAAAADTALRQGEIEAYYLIPPDYLTSGTVRRVSRRLPAGPVSNDPLNTTLVTNLLPGAEPARIERLRDPLGAGLRYAAEQGAQTRGVSLNYIPFIVTMVIIIPLFTSGGYLLQSLAAEKSNRVMEIMLVSLRPRQLLSGKLLGLGALAGVQYAIWITVGLTSGGLMRLFGRDFRTLLSSLNFSPAEVGYALLFALGGYAVYAAFLAGLGALAPDLESSRSWILLVTLPMFFPLYFWGALVQNPHSTLAVGLSLFPLSAPVAMLLRLTSSQVPAWQVLTSLVLLGLSALGLIRLMARLFRVQTLLSGEPLSARRIWQALRS